MENKSLRLSTEGLITGLFMNTAIAVNGNNEALMSVLDLSYMLLDEQCDEVILKALLVIAVAINNSELEVKVLQSFETRNYSIEFIESYQSTRGITSDENLIDIGALFMMENGLNPQQGINEITSKTKSSQLL